MYFLQVLFRDLLVKIEPQLKRLSISNELRVSEDPEASEIQRKFSYDMTECG